jgi:hypothetical protein
MLLGTFESNILAVNAMDDEAIEADAEIDEEDVVEADEDVEEPEDAGFTSGENSMTAVAAGTNTGADAAHAWDIAYSYGQAKAADPTFTATISGNTAKTVTWKVLGTDWKEATLPAGLTGTANGREFAISGAPTALTDDAGKTFILSAISTENSSVSVNGYVKIKVNKLAAADLNKTGDANWGADIYRMGYTVDASTTSSSANVVSRTITLTNTTGADITDLSVKLESGVSFNLVNGGENISLPNNGKLEIGVAPKTGLTVKGLDRYDASETFTDKLVISSNVINDDGHVLDSIPVSFKLGYDMAISATKDGAAFTGNSITVSAGNAMPVLAFTVTGGNGQREWNESGITDKLPAGVTANRSGDVVTISGTPVISSSIINSYALDMTAKDNKSQTADYNTISQSFTINVVAADMAYTANGDTKEQLIKFGNKNDLQAEDSVTIVATNNGQSKVTVNASLDSDKFYFDNKKQETSAELASGANATFVVYPKLNAVSDDTVKITLSGNALADKVFTYRLILENDVLMIVDPADGKLPNAVVGEDYSYTLKADGTVSLNALKWSVSSDSAVSEADLASYGLTLSANGLLYGTPKKVSDNALQIKVAVSNDSIVSVNTVSLNIVSSNTAIVVSANGAALEGKTASDNIVSLGTVTTKTENVSNNTAKIGVTNVSKVDLGDVTAEVVKTYKKNASGNYVETTTDFFKFVDANNALINTGKSATTSATANSTYEFYIIPETATALQSPVTTPDKAGDYRALVKVNTNTNIVAKEFYVDFTLQNTVVIATPNTQPFECTVGEAISPVSLNAVSKNGTDKLTNVEWSWTALSGSTLPEGLTLSQNGTLYGTPAKAGIYGVSVNVVDKTTNDTDTKPYVISVNGAATVELTKGSGDALSSYYFPGVVKGATVSASELEVAVKHKSGAALSDVKISLMDMKGHEGSAKHFKLSTDTIAKINVGGFEKFTIAPIDSTEAGEYAAWVVVSSNTIQPVAISVNFTVVEKLTINDVDASKLAAEVGQAYSLTVSAATISYNNAVRNGEITWSYKLVSANGAILNETIPGINHGWSAGTYSLAGVPRRSGSYIVSVNASLDASKYTGTTVDLAPAQTATTQFTIVVNKSASVNVISAIGNAGDYSVGKSTPASPSSNITAYTFAPRAVGYTATNLETAEFTLVNNAELGLVVSGNTTSSDFVVVEPADKTVALNVLTTSTGNTGVIKVAPKTGLAAGTYTADLVINGAQAADKVVTLSFTVEEAKDGISLSSNNTAISADGLALKPVKRTATADATTVVAKNSGNVDVKIVSINEVLDAAGTDIDINDTAKFKLTIDKTAAVNTTLKAATDETASFTVKPAKTDVAGEYTTYVKVTYSVGTTIKTPVVFAVKYTIYKDSVSVNITPSDNSVSLNGTVTVSENYSAAEATGYTKAFKVINGEEGVTGDTTDVLHKLTVSIDKVDEFVLASAEGKKVTDGVYTLDELAKGSAYAVTVAPKTGLPYGEYTAKLTVSADNMATQTKTITFKVTTKATTYTTDVWTTFDGKGVSDNVAKNAQRIFNTISANAATVSKDVNNDGKADIDFVFDSAVSANVTNVEFKLRADNTISTNTASFNAAAADVLDSAKPYYATIYFNVFDVVSFNAAGGKFANGSDVVSVNVAHFGKVAELPSVSMDNASLKAWMIGNKEFTTATVVSTNLAVTALWAEHTYPGSASGNTASINWTWNGSASNNFAGTYVTIYCVDADCPDRASSAIKLDATITVTGEDATCTKGQSKVYTATASKDGNTYTDTKEVANDEGLGHKWVFDTTSVVWAADYSTATISKNCVAPYHNDKKDGDAKVAVTTSNISFNGVSANCTTSGNGTYTATFTSADDPAISENIIVSIALDEVPALGHKWVVKSVESDGTFETAPTKGTLNIVCERDASHTESVSATTITFVSGNETEKTYKFAGKASDGQDVEKEETFYSHTEHVWDVKFTWVSVSTNKADTVVTAEATCKNGGEKKTLDVTLEDKTIGKKIEYTAKATDPNGKVWTSKKNIDTVTGEEKDGPAGTPTVEGGDIVIIGLEETYAYTGAKIKPVITVMDGDIVLAEKVDYTVSYTGKNKVNEINTVEVKGKGNYAGKSATAKFTIVDSRADIEPEELADKVAKVAVSQKKFTYNGKAQYPATVTVTLKDKSQIVYNVDEDGNFDTESEKKVGLSFSNNVKKGSATVAAMGSDGKVKKATYKIEAADINTATFVVDEATWAIKPEAAKITATFGDDDMELVAGQDFKVTYTAKAAGTGTAKITGKGNFKGKLATALSYDVKALELSDKNIIVSAVAGKKVSTVKVQVVDNAGNVFGKKLYSVAFYNGETELTKKDAIPEELTVVVKATGNATTDEDGISVTVTPAKDISKVKGAFKVDKNFAKTYTGEAIELDAEDFVAGKIDTKGLEYGTDFEVVSYRKNVKKGSMIVTVQGIGEYSGIKTFKVKINAKPIDKAVSED